MCASRGASCSVFYRRRQVLGWLLAVSLLLRHVPSSWRVLICVVLSATSMIVPSTQATAVVMCHVFYLCVMCTLLPVALLLIVPVLAWLSPQQAHPNTGIPYKCYLHIDANSHLQWCTSRVRFSILYTFQIPTSEHEVQRSIIFQDRCVSYSCYVVPGLV